MDEIEYDYTQLDEEDMELHLRRRAEQREEDEKAHQARIKKQNSFRWCGGMG